MSQSPKMYPQNRRNNHKMSSVAKDTNLDEDRFTLISDAVHLVTLCRIEVMKDEEDQIKAGI